MLRSSTLLEHGPRLPVQRQWNIWLSLAGVAAVEMERCPTVVAVVEPGGTGLLLEYL